MCQEFDGRVVYVKENGVSLLRGGRNFVPIRYSPPQDHELVATSPASWIPVRACGGVPEFQENGKRTEFAGISFEGKEMYVARATIGKSLLVGRIEKGMTCPVVAYFDREVRISFGHEILVSYEGLKWVIAKDGDVPANALVAGVEQDGTLLHIARGEVEHNQTIAGLRIGKSEVCLCLGKIGGKGYTGAKMTVDGREVEIKKYQTKLAETKAQLRSRFSAKAKEDLDAFDPTRRSNEQHATTSEPNAMDINATVPECDVVAVAEDVGGDGVDSDSSAPNPTTTTTTPDLAAFLIEHHRKDFTKAVFDAQRAKQSINARFSHYRIVLELDPMLLLDLDESLSLAHFDANMEKKLHCASVHLIQKASGDDKIYTEDVQLVMRAAYLPAIP
ncbi:hypothetical protein HDU99_007125, partial [Rhizoclosmatium hyalinum]